MVTTNISEEFDLKATPRYRRQNMAKAMGGKIERALVELITNSDDSYRDLEDLGSKVSGQIKIEVERKRGTTPSIVRVMDRAEGMSGEEMTKKLSIVGDRTSGFENGKTRRGLYGRGAKDIAIFGLTHFESIKDEKYSHFTISPSLKCKFENYNVSASAEKRGRLGIWENGTVVTVEVNSGVRIPHHEKLLDILSRYYSLRDIMSNSNRKVTLSDINTQKSARLNYEYPDGKIVLDDYMAIAGYPEAKVHVLIRQHDTAFEPDTSPVREGILIKSGAAIHDCTYFRLESDTFSWRFTGEIRCDYIDTLIRDYDNLECLSDNPIHPSNNPIIILDPNRDGLEENHPFTIELNKLCRKLLRNLIDELRSHDTSPKRKVSDEYLDKKLDSLSKAVSKVFENKLKELEEDIETSSEFQGTIANLPIGLHIIPPGDENIIVNVPRVFTVKIVSFVELNETFPITVKSSDPLISVRSSPVFLRRFSEDKKVATTTFVLESDIEGAKAKIEVNYNEFNNDLSVSVINPPKPIELPLGLSFDKPTYHLKVNKEKTLYLWLNVGEHTANEYQAETISGRREIIVKGGGKCSLKKTSDPGIFSGKFQVLGHRSKVKGVISANVPGFQPAHTNLIVEEKELGSHIKLQFHPDEDDFGPVRYCWDDENPYVLKIAARHPSIRQYLGTPLNDNYPGIDSQLYHGMLAEVVAEALAFRILESQFKTEGQLGMVDYTFVDANFHKHYSDFLTVCHESLNPIVDSLARQSKIL